MISVQHECGMESLEPVPTALKIRVNSKFSDEDITKIDNGSNSDDDNSCQGNQDEIYKQKKSAFCNLNQQQQQNDNSEQDKQLSCEENNSSSTENNMNNDENKNKNIIEWIEHECNDKNLKINRCHSDSLSFMNIICSITLWCFIFLQIMNAQNMYFGWLILAVCYIFYLYESFSSPIFKGIFSAFMNQNHLKQFIHSIYHFKPLITYQINRLHQLTPHKPSQIIPSNLINNINNNNLCVLPPQSSIQAPVDIESQQPNQINHQNQVDIINNNNGSINECKQNKKSRVYYIKNKIDLEYNKILNESVNIENILQNKNIFKLKININSQIHQSNDNNNLLQEWKNQKQQFMNVQKNVQNSQVISTFEYTAHNHANQSNQQQQQQLQFQGYYFKSQNQQNQSCLSIILYYLAIIFYSLFTIAGLSLFIRIIFNLAIPTVQINLVKKLMKK